MTTYNYKDSKIIDQVAFEVAANGGVRAYVHARDDATDADRERVIKLLRSEDIQFIPFTQDGKPVIELRGFKREGRLLALFDKNELIAGAPEITDKDDKLGWMEKLKKRSLQASGALYAFGDASFFMYGLKGSSPLDMAAGVAYAVPTPVLLAYGRNDQSELQIKDFAKLLAGEFKQHVETLPQDCALDSLTSDHKKGMFQNVNDLLQRYPSEFMNYCYAAAGACIALAGAKHLRGLAKSGAPEKAVEGWLKKMSKTNPAATMEMAAKAAHNNTRLENILNVGVGGTTIASGLFGALVQEKAVDPDDPKPKGVGNAWEWAREHPLSIAGAGFMVSTLLHAASTLVALRGEDAKHKKAVPYRVAFVVSALLAEFMVAISSKGHGEGVVSDQSVDASAIAIAAELIVKQPKALQNGLVDYLGRFIGRHDVLAMGDDKAIKLLRTRVEELRKNPWAKPVGEEAVPAGEAQRNDVSIPAWQTKVAVPEIPATHQPSA